MMRAEPAGGGGGRLVRAVGPKLEGPRRTLGFSLVSSLFRFAIDHGDRGHGLEPSQTKLRCPWDAKLVCLQTSLQSPALSIYKPAACDGHARCAAVDPELALFAVEKSSVLTIPPSAQIAVW
jgi:hypothetical protein